MAGLALSPAGPVPAAAIAGVALAGCAASGARGLGALAAVLALLGGAVGSARLDALGPEPGAALPGTRVEARATLAERPRATRFGTRAAIRTDDGVRLLARASADVPWPPGAGAGDVVSVSGRIVRHDARHRVSRDYAAHLRRRGIAGELRVDRIEATGERRGGAAGVVDGIRRRAERALGAGLGARDAALLRGMVLGQDDAIDDRTREDWRASGLAHLLAASGQNVALLCALALPLLALAGATPRARIGSLLALIAVYVPLAGAGPSIQRAGVMGAATLLATALARPASRWYALLLAAAVTLAINPLATGEPGWQLSFAAVAGIALLAKPLGEVLARASERDDGPGLGETRAPDGTRRGAPLGHALREGAAVTVAATLATAPLLAHHFGAVSIVAVPANIAALPAVAPVMWAGTVRAALGQARGVPVGGAAADAVNSALAPVAELPLRWVARVADVAASTGEPLETGLGSRGAALWLAALLAGGPPVLRRLARGRARSRAVVCAVAAVIAASAVPALIPHPAPAELTVSFLDVGQGDATLVQGADGSAVLFDGGPPEARVVRLLRRAGVRRLDAVVATHASRDHHGGLQEVVEAIPVRLLLDGGDGTADPAYRALVTAARRRGIPVVPALAGGRLTLGEVEIRILSPGPRAPGPPPDDPNPRAVVAIVRSGGFDLLLSADAESGTLAPLALPDVEAMKVPHHGSADPGLPALLERIRPEVAAIEVGAGNPYGHPAPSTLRGLAERVPHVYRTDRDGTVRIGVRGGAMRVRTGP